MEENMGAFQDAVSAQPLVGSKAGRILKAMGNLEDNSLDEFIAIMNDEDINARVIATAIEQSTGIEVSSRTISEWRRNKQKMEQEFPVA